MEITLLSPTSVRIKGKQGTLLVNPVKPQEANGIIILPNFEFDYKKEGEDTLIINGPGEYGTAGIKINGMRNSSDTVYTIRIDKIDLLFGRAETLAKDFNKLHEHHVALICADSSVDSSFVTSIVTNVVIFYGEQAETMIKKLAQENYRTETKYTTTFEKLPPEMEEILLA